jgi:hypothetical protein
MTITITRDLICDGDDDSCVGTRIEEMPLYGIERIIGIDPTIPTGTAKVAFRLYDGDEKLYYEGELDDDPDAANQSAALRWGETMAGCATIRVKRGRKWMAEIG